MIIFERSIAQNEEDLMHELTLTISSRVAELTAHVIDEMSIRRDAGCMAFQDSICGRLQIHSIRHGIKYVVEPIRDTISVIESDVHRGRSLLSDRQSSVLLIGFQRKSRVADMIY